MNNALGRHILVELHECQSPLLNDVAGIEKHMISAAQAAGATVINTTFHHFAPAGVSGVVVIQESHLSIHTWPEQHFAAVDIFTCGHHVEPWKAVSYLKKILEAQKGDAQEIPRGKTDQALPPPPKQGALPPIQHNLWFTERSDNIALSLRHSGVLLQTQSPYQKIEILQTAGYGRMLVLDGQIMCTEKDEYIYHEMITHVPALSHQNPENVLILGGGDGGAVRELIRHNSIRHIDLVEIDQAVVQTARTHLPTLSGHLNDPRVKVIFEDGVQFVHSAPANAYDLILIDIPGLNALQSRTFYQDIFQALSSSGIMVSQIPPPILFDPTFTQIITAQRSVFAEIYPYFAFIPTYATGMLSFAYAPKSPHSHPLAFDVERAQLFANSTKLHYYTPEIHSAAFAMPPFVQTLLASGASP